MASLKLPRLAARLRVNGANSEGDIAQHTLLAADITRLLERPADNATMLPAAPAPPGAPIGDGAGLALKAALVVGGARAPERSEA